MNNDKQLDTIKKRLISRIEKIEDRSYIEVLKQIDNVLSRCHKVKEKE